MIFKNFSFSDFQFFYFYFIFIFFWAFFHHILWRGRTPRRMGKRTDGGTIARNKEIERVGGVFQLFFLESSSSVRSESIKFLPVFIFRFKWRLSWCWSFKSMFDWNSFAILKKKKKIIHVESISIESFVLFFVYQLVLIQFIISLNGFFYF